ncbi:MAG: PQQ-binding-like beta-propeller repeat protein [Planctomycetes bacterium]|nr:PQQ-binding-like beta-propeller repeat protein [Planctomycetota bacterium]
MLACVLIVAGLLGIQDPIPGQQAPGDRAPADRALHDWPQGPGPNGDWSARGPTPPLRFSVRTGENVLWTTPLPETGQGGIAVVGGRLFVTTMAPWDPANTLSEAEARRFAHATENRRVVGKHIDAHCIDAGSGAILWTRRIEGSVPAIYTYPFSDATSASPVADGERVWFTNAAGRIACFTHAGEPVWERVWTPSFDGPFNKQFEPFLVRDGARQVLIHMEPFPPPGRDASDGSLAGRWHHLVGLDAATGELLWRSEDALTQYNAPTLVATPQGPAALIARGGPHAVPERPVGVSLVRLTGERAGGSRWRYEDPRGNHEAALQTMAHDERFAYWILREPRSALVVLDLRTGEELREISLTGPVDLCRLDSDLAIAGRRGMVTTRDATLDKGVFPARYSMIAAAGRLFFQCYATAWGKPTIGPAYSFARVDPTTGAVAYLEVPTDVEHGEDGSRSYLWRTPRTARPLNGRGEEVTGDDRCRWDGWDWVFNGSPTRVNDRLYFTLASGVVYVFDAARESFDQSALLAVCDLGEAGETWSANSISYAGGRLYHRTGSHLICVGHRPDDR